MKIIQLTPGTGNFYCGSCIRDNAFVKAVRLMGHEITMVPLYLPFVVDDKDEITGELLFMGGINMYLQHKLRLFRHTPRWLDRLFDSPKLLRLSSKKAGMTKAEELGDMTYSMLQGEVGSQHKEVKRLINWLKNQQPIDVISISNALLTGMVPAIKRELNVPIVCTLQGEDGFLDSLPQPYRDQCWQLLSQRMREVDKVIPVSEYHGNLMKERLGLPNDQVHVVLNGISLEGYEERTNQPEHRTIGYLARMCEAKGLHRLVDTFLAIKKKDEFKDVKLRVIGTKSDADEAYVTELMKRIREAQFEDDVELYPNVSREEKIRLLQSLTVLSVPVTYSESFGLYVIEALASGVPVVQPRSGGFPEILNRTGGGVLYEAEDQPAYQTALENILADSESSFQQGAEARKKVFDYFHVERMTQDILAVYKNVIQKRQTTAGDTSDAV